ncbi:MAG: hypothetical protein LBO78_01865, partial [Rickettsiales bacterium]|nr:hypothetical protein [Rickettsiales bacterium]
MLIIPPWIPAKDSLPGLDSGVKHRNDKGLCCPAVDTGLRRYDGLVWIPAFAGMTDSCSWPPACAGITFSPPHRRSFMVFFIVFLPLGILFDAL